MIPYMAYHSVRKWEDILSVNIKAKRSLYFGQSGGIVCHGIKYWYHVVDNVRCRNQTGNVEQYQTPTIYSVLPTAYCSCKRKTFLAHTVRTVVVVTDIYQVFIYQVDYISIYVCMCCSL